MVRIVRFRVQGLWNSEYPLVVFRLLDIVERHNPHAIHLGFAYDRLMAFRPQLESITVQERADRESAQLSELDQQRDTLFNVIYQAAKAFQRAPIGEVSDNAHLVVSTFKKHGKNIPASNYTAETKRLFDLEADVSAQPEIKAALEKLALLPVFEQMCQANKEFEALFMERKIRRGEDPRIDTRNVRLECDKAITFLWNTIEMCIVQHGAEQYETLVGTINALNSYYKTKLTARATRRKAKQAVDKEEPIEPFEIVI